MTKAYQNHRLLGSGDLVEGVPMLTLRSRRKLCLAARNFTTRKYVHKMKFVPRNAKKERIVPETEMDTF